MPDRVNYTHVCVLVCELMLQQQQRQEGALKLVSSSTLPLAAGAWPGRWARPGQADPLDSAIR